MKIAFIFLSTVMLAQTTFAMSNRELTAKVASDKTFVNSAENDIKNIFRKPKDVLIKFRSVAVQDKGSHFVARFTYAVTVEGTTYGTCPFEFEGVAQADSTIKYNGLVHYDCGE